MGTYLPVPPGQPKTAWLIANAGASELSRPPLALADVPPGMALVAVVAASDGDEAMLIAGQADYDAALHTTRYVRWLLIGQDRVAALTGGPAVNGGPVTPEQETALRALAALELSRHDWVSSDMLDEVTGTNSTPVMKGLAAAGLVRRIHYGRRYAYLLTDAGRAAISGG